MKLTSFAVVALAVLLGVGSVAQAQENAVPTSTSTTAEPAATEATKEAPALPAFDKEPYVGGEEVLARQRLYPEREPQNAVLYGTPDLLNAVYVYLTKEGTNQYAAWYTRTAEDAPTFTVRGYNYTDGKWVFEKEASFPNQ